MKLFNAPQIKDWDAATIKAQGQSPWQLMERAASACAGWLMAHYSTATPFVILCGRGGNGGDGMAAARLLLREGYAVKALLAAGSRTLTGECAINRKALEDGWPDALMELPEGSMLEALPDDIVIVDALLGAGLSRPLDGWMAALAASVNKLPNRVVSIDVPSGIFADKLQAEADVAIRADDTLCFQSHKRALLHPESGSYAGEVHVLDIALDAAFAEGESSEYATIDEALLKRIYKKRKPFSHKGTLGMALIAGGSYGMIGAAVLAVQAAGRAGAGKVRGLVPECGYSILQTCAPEAMCKTSGVQNLEEIAGHAEGAAGIGIGPGMGSEPKTVAAFERFLRQCKQPIVLDAEALNILGKNREWLKLIPQNSILTPHPKEFERMFGGTADSMERIEKAREAAKKHRIFLVMKDRHTVIVSPEGTCWYNLRGNAGMATGGSGDVLCGVIAGLLAQQYEPFAAAVLGVHLHAAAGDAAARETGQEAIVAGDLVRFLGKAFLELGSGRAVSGA